MLGERRISYSRPMTSLVVRSLMCLLVAAILVAGCSSEDKDPAATPTASPPPLGASVSSTAPPTDQGAPKATSVQLRGRFLPHLESMVVGLKVALGDSSWCQSPPCNHEQGFAPNLEGIRVLCVINYSGGLIAEYGIDPAVGNVIKAFKQGCDLFMSSLQTLGPPAHSPAWRDAASAVLDVIQQVAVSERARSP